VREAAQWSLLGGVALIEAARAGDPEPGALSLRWPNDLLRHGANAPAC
jgi:biotin-(acetyl-CoA carboxylase) ligase